MTIKEWDQELDSFSGEELDNIIKAINTLETWPAFKREYGWTGIQTLLDMLTGNKAYRSFKAKHNI